MKDIGEKLKASREESGLSLEEVSEDLRISVSDIKNIEQGNKDAFLDNYAHTCLTSAAVLFLLSVDASTITATPFGPYPSYTISS